RRRHHRGGDRRGRARRVHLPRCGDGGQPHDPGRRAAGGRAGGGGRAGAERGGAPGEAATVRWALLVLAALAACGRREDVIVVGSKNFTEQRILGELLAQTVEWVGRRAARKRVVGGGVACDAARRAGQGGADAWYPGPAGADRARVGRQGGAGAGKATDGPIESRKRKVLVDDRGACPPYEAAPGVRGVVLERCPKLAAALEGLGGKISAERMRRMNYEVDGGHRGSREVVRELHTAS